jgi:hypothetical protein
MAESAQTGPIPTLAYKPNRVCGNGL